MVFMAEYSMHCQASLLWIARRDALGIVQRARIEWEDVRPQDMPEPTITVHDRDNYRGTSQLQFLFNALWDLGFRPPGSAPSENLVATKDAHLDDLRTILFNQLGIQQ
jgi:hypothetical protein